MTQEEAKANKRDFMDQVLSDSKFDGYLAGCGLSWAGNHDKKAPAGEQNDLCIVVNLSAALPDGVTFPSSFQGMKVFAEVVGEIRSL